MYTIATVWTMADRAERRRELRLAMRRRRAALATDDQAAASMAVMARLARVPVLREATVVAGYRAVRGEVDIDAVLALLIEQGATVTVPCVVGEHLEFAVWTPDSESVPGSFGIPEPIDSRTVAFATHDVALVPLVAFDGDGNRLGQGGGFYDRALTRGPDRPPVTIGIAHAFQEVGSIPIEPWDVALDAVVTEDGARAFAAGSVGNGF